MTDERKTTDTPEQGGTVPGRRRRWLVRVALSLTSVIVALLIAELVATLTMPGIAPVLVRDDFYVNPLPLITGVGPPLPLNQLPTGDPLPEEKQDNEFRVAVLGESSVAGSPFDVHLSFPAMLYDMLRDLAGATAPDKLVRVINMGRPSSICTNVYYYLLYLRRYQPDVIVFYMGMNDSPFMPGEQCSLVESPITHALWRGLVSRSWFLWLARAWGPNLVWSWSSGLSMADHGWYPEELCSEASFAAWTALLTETARDIGARVIIAPPMASAAKELEPPVSPPEVASDQRDLDLPAPYKDIMICALTPSCDFSAELKAVLATTPATDASSGAIGVWSMDDDIRETFDQRLELWSTLHGLKATPSLLEFHRMEINSRAKAWEDAAKATPGAEFIPFHHHLEDASPNQLLAYEFFGDWMRLSPRGYYLLASYIAERIRPLLGGGAPRPVAVPGAADVKPYLDVTETSGVTNAMEQFRFGGYLTVVRGLQLSLELFAGNCEEKGFCEELDTARLALAWLRVRSGLAHGLPEGLLPRLKDFNPYGDKRFRGSGD